MTYDVNKTGARSVVSFVLSGAHEDEVPHTDEVLKFRPPLKTLRSLWLYPTASKERHVGSLL